MWTVVALLFLWPLGYLTFFVWYTYFRRRINDKRDSDGGWRL
jgi:hypothetical protein